MLELQHRPIPTPTLTEFIATHPNHSVSDFDSGEFREVKKAVKADLNQDQDGLCVYCESRLAAKDGHVEHIKPKAGKYAHPDLCFTYTNLAHSCTNSKTCGQKKKGGLLEIEPGIGCNAHWTLITNGEIIPIKDLARDQEHLVKKTCGMLGLNVAALVDARQSWLKHVIALLQDEPDSVQQFLETAPYRFILATVL